jgi:hypothetical protein
MPDEPTRPLQVSTPAPEDGPTYYPLSEQPYRPAPDAAPGQPTGPAKKRPVTPVVAGILGAVLGLVVGIGGTLVVHQSSSGTATSQVGPGGRTRPSGAPGNGGFNGNGPGAAQPSASATS